MVAQTSKRCTWKDFVRFRSISLHFKSNQLFTRKTAGRWPLRLFFRDRDWGPAWELFPSGANTHPAREGVPNLGLILAATHCGISFLTPHGYPMSKGQSAEGYTKNCTRDLNTDCFTKIYRGKTISNLSPRLCSARSTTVSDWSASTSLLLSTRLHRAYMLSTPCISKETPCKLVYVWTSKHHVLHSENGSGECVTIPIYMKLKFVSPKQQNHVDLCLKFL